MATLTITQNEDFSDGNPPIPPNTTDIVYDTNGVTNATFLNTQFGKGLIENNVEVTGDAFLNFLNVNFGAAAATFTAAGWSFVNWTAGEDFVNIRGSVGDDTLIGSSEGDRLEGRGGVDTVQGGGGDDEIRYQGADSATGETIDGGQGADRIEFIGGGGTTDFSAATIISIEILDVSTANVTATFKADQIGAGKIEQIVGQTSGTQSIIVNGSDVDLRTLKFEDWGGAGQTITINGTSISSNVLFGSSESDTISGTAASTDLITGGGGKDTLLGGKGGDNFRYFAGAEAVAGEVVDGGLGIDNFSLFNTGAIDLGALTTSGIDGLDFVSGNSAATLRGDQIGGTKILSVSGSAGVDQITVNAVGQSADLSKVGFSFWTNGTDSIAINGAAAVDTLIGSSQNDTIDGGAGADVMSAGGGSDVYRVDDAGDVTNEGAAAGTQDRVITVVDYTLGAGAEIELFTTNSSSGKSAIDLTGNTLAQEIAGNAGVNTLNDGGVGAADTLRGFGGNDTYRVFNSGDVIIESSTQGVTDRVTAAVDYVLGKGVFIELFTTNGSSGTSDIDLTGNEVAQEILGNAGDNRLEGKGGADSLRGFGGADSFTFATALGAGNIDTIVDFNVADDRFLLSDAIFTALTPGTLSAAAFRANTTGLAQDASDRIVYETDTGKLFYDEDGTGALAGIQFATISVNLALTNADFSVA